MLYRAMEQEDMYGAYRQVMLTRYDRGDIEEVEDIVVIEYPLTIYLNDEELVTLLCSPASLEFLVIGFFYLKAL